MLKNISFYASLLEEELVDGKPTSGMVLVYGAIEAHSMGEKGCIASNKTIAQECGLKESSTASYISILAKNGWIRVNLDENNHRIRIEPLMCIKPPFDSDKTPLLPQSNIEYSNKNTVIRKDNLVEIQSIYDLYIESFETNKNKYKLTPLRVKKIKARLDDAGSEMLRQAIQNVASSDFHRGKNERRWKADLDFIIRSYEQVEKLSNMDKGEKKVSYSILTDPRYKTVDKLHPEVVLTDEDRKRKLDSITELKKNFLKGKLGGRI